MSFNPNIDNSGTVRPHPLSELDCCFDFAWSNFASAHTAQPVICLRCEIRRGGNCLLLCTGIEDIFKTLRRLCSKGAENGTINMHRLYLHAALAGPACFPNVSQQQVTRDDMESVRGHGGASAMIGPWLQQDRTRSGLALKSFRPADGPAPFPKPKAGAKTCTAAAHSQQVGLEEALLMCGISSSGQLTRTEFLTRSWVGDLIDVVRETAVSLLQPTVLVDTASDAAYLIILDSARCLWGWPLRVHSARRRLLVQQTGIRCLQQIVLQSPSLGLLLAPTHDAPDRKRLSSSLRVTQIRLGEKV